MIIFPLKFFTLKGLIRVEITFNYRFFVNSDLIMKIWNDRVIGVSSSFRRFSRARDDGFDSGYAAETRLIFALLRVEITKYLEFVVFN